MKQVIIPAPFRLYTDGQVRCEVGGETVGAVLQELAARFPDLRPQLYDDEGRLRYHIHVFVREQEISSLQGEQTPLHDGDHLILSMPIAGG